MRSLLERHISRIPETVVLLAPPQASVPPLFRNRRPSSDLRSELVATVQRFRGGVYVRDGALHLGQLSNDGRHETPEDVRAWHLLMLDEHRRLTACLWYMEHPEPCSFEDLRIKSCPITLMPEWRGVIQRSIADDLGRARAEQVAYAEVGGWAAEKQHRCCSDGLLLILSTFALSRVFGGALGVTTATMRHSSAAILRRLGLSYLSDGSTTVPPYFDEGYGCQMEMLRFDTRRANPRYEGLIRLLGEQLENLLVLTAEPPTGQVSAPMAAETTVLRPVGEVAA